MKMNDGGREGENGGVINSSINQLISSVGVYRCFRRGREVAVGVSPVDTCNLFVTFLMGIEVYDL